LPEPSIKLDADQEKIYNTLEDLLTVAMATSSKLQPQANVSGVRDIIELDNLQKLQHLKQLTDEHSETNKGAGRLVPLIAHVIYEMGSSSADDPLIRVTLTDVLGSAARTLLHTRRLREQLSPEKTDAILLVMGRIRPESGTDDLLKMIIERVLIANLDASRRACFSL
jgi:hypothetical protein